MPHARDALDTTPFVFVSHANADKGSVRFREVIKTLLAHGVPLGLDRPHNVDDPDIRPDAFFWSLGPDGGNVGASIARALGQGACAALFLLSRNTPDGNGEQQGTSYIWREVLAAEAIKAARHADGGFECFYLLLDDEALTVAPSARSLSSWHVRQELAGLVRLLLEHCQKAHALCQGRADNDWALEQAARRLIAQTEWIKVLGKKSFGGGNRQLRLDAVYTALRGEVFSAEERAAAHGLYGAAQPDPALWRGAVAPGGERVLDPLKRMPIMPGVLRADEEGARYRPPIGKRENLATLVRENLLLVLLGEPASGKTTLLKWLALRFAENWVANFAAAGPSHPAPKIFVDAQEVDPFSTATGLVDLGTAKFPVFITLQELAKVLAEQPGRSLFAVLATQLTETMASERGERNAAGHPQLGLEQWRVLLEGLASDGKLIVLLDGLDEVPDPAARQDAITAIEQFQRHYLPARDADLRAHGTGSKDGNRLIVTSRIVGYHILPLPDNWPHVVVERMAKQTVKRYWQRLHDIIGLDNKETIATGADPVEVLFNKIYDSGRRGVDELAGIPLLATLLAVIFKADGRLPDYRVEIYDRAITHLVEDWSDRPRSGHTSAVSWKRLLCTVACEMHDSPTQALLHRTELIDQLMARQRDLNARLADFQSRVDPAAMVDVFLQDNNDAVGILIERADGYFAFLHRTFQEYLASTWLLDEPDLAAARISEKMDDPRWREPVLLAFGHESLQGEARREQRDRLVAAMLATPEAGMAARRARFIAIALAEMPSLPSLEIYIAILSIVLNGADGQRLSSLTEVQREDIEDAIFAMADRDPASFERALVRLLGSTDGAVRAAAAHLIADNRWRSEHLLAALEQALPGDEACFAHAISRAVSQIRTALAYPEVAKLLDERERPLTPASIDEIDWGQVGAGTPEQYVRLMDRVARLRASYQRRLRRWRVGQFLTQDLRLSEKRSYLHQQMQRLAQEPGEKAAIAALHGAFGDYGNDRISDDYRNLAGFLQKSDATREILLDEGNDVLLRFGHDEPIYGAAVYLDTLGGRRVKAALAMPVFDLRQSTLLSRSPLVSDRPTRRWGRDSVRHSRAAAALVSPDLTLAEILRATSGELDLLTRVCSLDATARAALRSAARRAGAMAGDAAFRAFGNLVANDPVQAGPLPPAHCLAFTCALETVARLLPNTPIQFDKWAGIGDRASCEAAVFGLAGLHSDKTVHAAAVALDRLQAMPLERMSAQLQFLPCTVLGAWLPETMAAAAGSFWPVTARRIDVNPRLIDEAARWNVDGAHVALAFALMQVAVGKVVQSDDRDAALALAPLWGLLPIEEGLGASLAPRESLLASVTAIADPYWRARGLLVLAELGLSELRLEEIRTTAQQLVDPLERFTVLERLAGLCPDQDAVGVQESAIAAAHAIADSCQRWRALLSLVRSGTGARDELVKDAAAALNAIVDPWQRAEAWMDARRVMGVAMFAAQSLAPCTPPPGFVAEDAGRALTNAALRGYAAPLMLKLTECGNISDDAALALYAARACLDVQDALDWADAQQAATQSAALAAAGPQAGSLGEELLDSLAATPPHSAPDLTPYLAQAIVGLYDRDPPRAAMLAQAIGLRSMAALGAATLWLKRPRSPLAWRAAVEIGRRTRRRDLAVLEPLLHALASEEDDAKVMAAEILMRGSNLWKRLPRLFTASEITIDALLTAGEFLADPEQVSVSSPVRIFLLDVIHDDPEVLREVLTLAAQDDETGKAARIVLEETGEARPDACARLRDAFGGASRKMQIALLKGFANRAICDPSFAVSDHVEWLRNAASHIAAPIYFWRFDVEDVIEAATLACAGGAADNIETLAAAETALAARRVDLRNILRLNDLTEVEDGLKAFIEHTGASGGDARPIRDGTGELDALLTAHGPVAVKLFGNWLRQLLLTGNSDLQLLGALAFATAQASIRFPDQAALALFGPSVEDSVPKRAKEKDLRRQMHLIFKDRPTSLAGASLLLLAATSGRIEADEVAAILNGALSPNPVSDRRVENILRQVKEVDDGALGVLEDAMASPSLRKRRVAIRLLGAFLRTPANPGAGLRQAVDLLTRYAYTSDGRAIPFGIDSRTEQGEGAFLFQRQSLGETALRELRRAWS